MVLDRTEWECRREVSGLKEMNGPKNQEATFTNVANAGIRTKKMKRRRK